MPCQVQSSFRYGSTQQITELITEVLRESDLLVDIKPLKEAKTLAAYNAIVMGAPLFMFHWHKDALSFLAKHRNKSVYKNP